MGPKLWAGPLTRHVVVCTQTMRACRHTQCARAQEASAVRLADSAVMAVEVTAKISCSKPEVVAQLALISES